MNMSYRVYIGLGSNLGQRRRFIKRALKHLQALGVRLIKVSSFYETEPVGGPLQGKFINAVAEIETELNPVKLLRVLKDTEQELGRKPTTERWGPREIDIDILVYEDRIISRDDLIIPHPLLHTRRFVLEPLAEIAPELEHPVLKQTIADLLSELPQDEE